MRPSEALALVLADLEVLGDVYPANTALARVLPGPSPDPRWAIALPAMLEQSDESRKGGPLSPASLIVTWQFNFLASVRDQSQGPSAGKVTPAMLAAYDSGSRLREVFTANCQTRLGGCSSVVVGPVTQNPPGAESGAGTFGGSFTLTIRLSDDSHITAYTPAAGIQPAA